MRRTQQQWQALVQQQRDSDCSIKDFYLEHSVSTSSFYKHKARWLTHSEATISSPFSQVALIAPTTVVTSHTINLKIGSVNMTFDSHTHPHWLARLVKELV